MYTAANMSANSVPIHICNSIEADDENGGWLGKMEGGWDESAKIPTRVYSMETGPI
jgi:hypothetical protein